MGQRVWILQDNLIESLSDKLAQEGVDSVWDWRVDSHEDPIARGDVVLLWQPSADGDAAAACAIAEIIRPAFYSPNEKTNFLFNLKIRKVFETPITRNEIRRAMPGSQQEPLIMRKNRGRIIARLTDQQWEVIRSLRPELQEI